MVYFDLPSPYFPLEVNPPFVTVPRELTFGPPPNEATAPRSNCYAKPMFLWHPRGPVQPADQIRKICAHKVTMHPLSLVSVSRFVHARWRSAFTVHRSPFTVHRSPFTVHCSLFTVHCSPFTVHRSRSPFTVHRSLFTVHRSPFTVHRSLFTVHRSLFTVHRSLFTVHRSPFTFTTVHSSQFDGVRGAAGESSRFAPS